MSKFDDGLKVRRALLGDAHVDRATKNITDFDADFQKYITENVWGEIWTRPNLDRKTRHLVTIAMLAALGKEHELAMHIRACVNTGVTDLELQEIFLHVAVYAGVPAANQAFSIAKEIIKAREETA